MTNGIRTFRPDLPQYVFATDSLQTQAMNWVEGVKNGTAIRALLISGPSGTGKTTLALALAGALGAEQKSIQEINCASTRTLEDARELIDGLGYLPTSGAYRVLLLDEVHQMVSNAQQAFLTPIEKLPSRSLLIACTTEPEKLVHTFRNRFYEIKQELYSEEKIFEILENLPETPKQVSPAFRSQIARAANGNPRRAMDLLERYLVDGGNDSTLAEKIQNEMQAPDLFLEAYAEMDYKKAYLATRLVKEENKKAFFDRVQRIVETLWSTCQNFHFAQSPADQKFVIRLLELRKAKQQTGYARGELVRLLSTLSDLESKPLGYLRILAMNLEPKA